MGALIALSAGVVRHDAGVAQPESASGRQDAEQKQSDGLSQFIGKVLDQLSLSAWLPAAMLVGCGAILVQLRAQGTFDLGAALIALTAKPLGIVVVLFFAMILATMISQAFSFGAIRFLEGYWSGALVTVRVYALLVRHQARKRRRLYERQEKCSRLATEQAFRAMRAKNVSLRIVHLLEEIMAGDEDRELTDQELAVVAEVDWQTYSPPELLGRIAQLAKAYAEYPQPHRLMPTKLGNVLRATEDKIVPDGTDTEGFMLRHGGAATPRLRQHHDQFRTRLDMYCTLVFVQVALALGTVALLGTGANPFAGTVIVTAIFAALAATSYSAAISSARGYCSALRAIFDVAEPSVSLTAGSL